MKKAIYILFIITLLFLLYILVFDEKEKEEIKNDVTTSKISSTTTLKVDNDYFKDLEGYWVSCGEDDILVLIFKDGEVTNGILNAGASGGKITEIVKKDNNYVVKYKGYIEDDKTYKFLSINIDGKDIKNGIIKAYDSIYKKSNIKEYENYCFNNNSNL